MTQPGTEPTPAHMTFDQYDEEVLGALRPPGRSYFIVMAFLGAGVLLGVVSWIVQVKVGMGLTGLKHPVMWGIYLVNFVFWVGIAHSGTLISAILHLVRSKWRTSVSRSAEAMTVFAVMTAGLFPLIHLGRMWVFYFIIPYPSERQLWPDFLSPLVWDVCAISTYLMVSTIFWYVGLVPDLGSARDRANRLLGADHPRSKLYRFFSLGWCGAGSQWRHFGRGYLFFAALATPLVVSVHSVVSWDFAMGILPGWHTTIFAPYFVAGAIHSGLAMVLTLVIPMRALLNLKRVVTVDHFEAVAKTIIVTSCIVGYAYVVEPFISWYSGDIVEGQFAWWRATGWIAPAFWALPVLNVFIPLLFLWKKMRRNLTALFIISICVNLGMWLERFVIIIGSTAHDFLPHNWDYYLPRPVELFIMAASFCFFLFWFFAFAKSVPTVALSDVKDESRDNLLRGYEPDTEASPVADVRKKTTGVVGVFRDPDALVNAAKMARANGFDELETFSPVRVREAEVVMGRGPSPVRLWTLIGALCGLAGGFWLAIGSAQVNNLIAGAKWPVSIIPYCIVAFEGTILLGTFANLAGVLVHARLGMPRLPAAYDERFSRDRYGLWIACDANKLKTARLLLADAKAEETRVL